MKKQFTIILFFPLLFLMCIISSCDRKGKELKDNNITFDSIQIKAVQHLFNDTTKPKCTLDMKFIYPSEYKKKEILLLLQKQFNKDFFGDKYEDLTPQEAAEQYKEDYLDEYKKVEKDYLEDKKRSGSEENPTPTWYSFYQVGSACIYFNKGDLLAYVAFSEAYYGGAHPSRVSQYTTIDMKTGLPLTEADIFIEDYQKELNSILLSTLLEENEVKTAEELGELGYFGALELTSNNNFLIDEKGITYLYNQYEIAAYMLGAIRIFVPYTDIKHILKEKSPISKLVD